MPGAYLAKAGAETDAGQGGTALKTLDKLSKLIEKNQLSKRYDLECRLAKIRADDKRSGDARRTDLGIIVREAGAEFPTVKSRAEGMEGEVFLSEAEGTVDPKKAAELRGKAQVVFERILKTQGTTNATLAGAYTGLGECLFYKGAEKDDKEALKDASMNFLRVITLFKTESRYCAKSLYFAMRSFHLMQDRGRKADMFRELKYLYPDTFVAGHKLLDWKMGATNTVVLITSSLTMALAVRAAQTAGQGGGLIPLAEAGAVADWMLSQKTV